MKKTSIINHSGIGLFCIVLLSLSSCRSTRVMTETAVAKPISAGKLIRNIENNAFDYSHLAIKKISCQFDNRKTKTSFKASVLAQKDSRITVMLSKLNIPVGRLWLTPDSVKFINYLDDNYFLDDYSYLSSMLEMNIDFETINAIISNNVFSLRDKTRDKDEFEVKIDSGLYVLESLKNLKSKPIKARILKQARKVPKINTDAPVRQAIYIDPVTFKLRKIRMDDPANSRKLTIDFSDFVAIDKQLYPGQVFLYFVSPESVIELKIKLGGFSTEKEKDIRFKIPENFTRLNTN